MSLFRGEEVAAPNIDVPIIVKSASATNVIGPIIDATGQTAYLTVVNGITLTVGDVPLFSWIDKDGTPHVAVFRDSDDTIVTRS